MLKKRASGEEFGEFFKIIFEEIEGREETMSVEKVIEYIFTFFLVANETTPGVLVATIKLISDNPKVMQELKREHERIVRNKTEKEEADLTWEDYKSMTFTQMVRMYQNHIYYNFKDTKITQTHIYILYIYI